MKTGKFAGLEPAPPAPRDGSRSAARRVGDVDRDASVGRPRPVAPRGDDASTPPAGRVAAAAGNASGRGDLPRLLRDLATEIERGLLEREPARCTVCRVELTRDEARLVEGVRHRVGGEPTIRTELVCGADSCAAIAGDRIERELRIGRYYAGGPEAG